MSHSQKMGKYKSPPTAFLRVIVSLYFNGQVPDSSKARDVIVNLMRKDGHDIPYMWLYAYNKYGIVTQKTAINARRYKEGEIRAEGPFTGLHEMKSLEVVQVFDESVKPRRKQCLPYILVNDTQETIPYCK